MPNPRKPRTLGSCLIRENHEHLYPRNIPAIRYIAGDINLEGLFGHAVTLSDNTHGPCQHVIYTSSPGKLEDSTYELQAQLRKYPI